REARQHLVADGFEAPPVRAPRLLVLRPAPPELAPPHAEGEAAVLAHDARDRPHASQVVAPSRGPAGDGDAEEPRVVGPPQRRVCLRGELPVRRERIVDVEKEAPGGARDRGGQLAEGPHGEGLAAVRHDGLSMRKTYLNVGPAPSRVLSSSERMAEK